MCEGIGKLKRLKGNVLYDISNLTMLYESALFLVLHVWCVGTICYLLFAACSSRDISSP